MDAVARYTGFVTVSIQPKPFVTREEYLEIERTAEHKSEYFNGEMFAITGGSLNHAMITGDVAGTLREQLRGMACRIASSDLRLQAGAEGLFTYPDIVVFCGKPKFVESRTDTITDATLIIEILSPSTENDRGFKFEQYRKIPSLKDYLVVAQDRIHVEHYTRQGDGSWNLRETAEPDAVLQLPSIGCSFRVCEAYERAEFGPLTS